MERSPRGRGWGLRRAGLLVCSGVVRSWGLIHLSQGRRLKGRFMLSQEEQNWRPSSRLLKSAAVELFEWALAFSRLHSKHTLALHKFLLERPRVEKRCSLAHRLRARSPVPASPQTQHKCALSKVPAHRTSELGRAGAGIFTPRLVRDRAGGKRAPCL